jgi:branched-chain amino acid transport system permease protein
MVVDDLAGTDATAVVRNRFRRWVDDQARALVADDLIREYVDQPVGQHSDVLERLLIWLRTAPLADREVIVVVQDGSFVLGRLPERRGGAMKIVDGTRTSTRADAERLVFLRRVAALRTE